MSFFFLVSIVNLQMKSHQHGGMLITFFLLCFPFFFALWISAVKSFYSFKEKPKEALLQTQRPLFSQLNLLSNHLLVHLSCQCRSCEVFGCLWQNFIPRVLQRNAFMPSGASATDTALVEFWTIKRAEFHSITTSCPALFQRFTMKGRSLCCWVSQCVLVAHKERKVDQ